MRKLFAFLGFITLFSIPCDAQDEDVLKKQIHLDDITLVTTEWEPFLGPNLPKQGLIADIARKAFKKVDIHVKAIKFRPWLRAMNESANGKFTGVIGAYYSEKLKKNYVYSKPMLASFIAIVAKKGRQAKKAHPSTIRNYGQYGDPKPHIMSAHFENPLDQDHFLHLTRQNDRKTPAIMGDPIEHKTVHLIISRVHKNAQDIIDRFNKGLQILKKSGELEKICQTYQDSLQKESL